MTLDETRLAAKVMVMELAAEGTPISRSRLGVQILFARQGLALPDDVFGYLSDGLVSDRDVKDWSAPDGGVVAIQ